MYMNNSELKKAEALYEVAVDQWMYTDSSDEIAEILAVATANWTSDNLLEARAKAKKDQRGKGK